MTELIKQIDKTEYITKLGSVPYAQTDIKIGSDASKFMPEILSNKWDEEAWIRIVHNDSGFISNLESYTNGLIELVAGNFRHRYYVDVNKNLEYEIAFASNPGNYIEFDIEFSKGLSFTKQPTLEEEYLEGLWPEYKTLEDFLKVAYRPEDVVGGYAIYHNKRNNKYCNGKVAQLNRSWVIDRNNNKAWVDQIIDPVSRKVGVFFDDDWLSKAAYPFKFGPTLGYEQCGGSQYGDASYYRGTNDITDGSGGNIDTYYACVKAVHGTSTGLKMGVYETAFVDTRYDPSGQDLVEDVEGVATVSDTWSVSGGSSALSASTNYSIFILPEHDDTKYTFDNTGSYLSWNIDGESYAAAFTDPAPASMGYASRAWGVWVDYGSAGNAYTAEGDLNQSGEIERLLHMSRSLSGDL